MLQRARASGWEPGSPRKNSRDKEKARGAPGETPERGQGPRAPCGGGVGARTAFSLRVPAKHICVCFLFCAEVRPSSNPAWWPGWHRAQGRAPMATQPQRRVEGEQEGDVNSTCSLLLPRGPRVRRLGAVPKLPRVGTALGPSVKNEISLQAWKLWWTRG